MSEAVSQTRGEAPPLGTVLLVQRSEVSRAIHARNLAAAGWRVVELRDGIAAVVRALEERPDVIVTELTLPTMEGFPLLRVLKADPDLAAIPVLALSNEGEAASRFWGRRLGAEGTLALEASPEELRGAVAVLAAIPRKKLDTPPPSALDLLSRVARRLDSALLKSTLLADLLAAGLGAADFHDAARASLQLVGSLVETRLLAVAVGTEEQSVGHAWLPRPAPPELLERLRQRLGEWLALPAGAAFDFAVTGERGGAPADLAAATWVPLELRSSRAVLVVLPVDPEQYELAVSELVSGLASHLGLVLENALLSERLHDLSQLDGLTRLLNHRAIYERLGEEIERSRRYRQPLSVVLADFDRFKEINDRHGHLAGDATLRESAALMRRSLRTTDLLGRYGGEEFLAILPQVDLEAARQAAERMRRELEAQKIVLPNGESETVTASFGVAALSELVGLGGEVRADQLVAVADRRLYEAKGAGRNQVRP